MPEPSEPRTRYQYSKLESDQIRLLRVVSARDIIRCRIGYVPLHQAPNYHALSYVWGDEEQDVEIIVNASSGERSFYVTAHLAAGIRQVARLLDAGGKHQPRFIWVDAICINQDDLSEKETQIPLMGSIYANASMVCIWLGEPSKDALLAMTILQGLMCHSQILATKHDFKGEALEIYVSTCPEEGIDGLQSTAKELQDELFELGFGVDDLDGLVNVYNTLLFYPDDSRIDLENRLKSLSSELPILNPEHRIWSVLLTFFNHPWFSRIWTLQELLLAQEAYVMSGHTVIPWAHYRNVRSLLLLERCVGSVYSNSSVRELGFKNLLGEHNEFRTSSRLDRSSWRLDKLLLGLVRRHARVEKDYIYGILGIVDDSIRRQIPIDYSPFTPTATVFAQATRLACEMCEMDEAPTDYWNILMMAHASRKRKIEMLPSWCPDFSNGEVDDDIVTCDSRPLISDTVAKTYKSYAWMEFPVGTNLLIIPGFRLDYVDEVIPPPDILSFTEAHAFMRDPGSEIDDTTFSKLFGAKQLKWLNDMASVFGTRGDSNATFGGWPRNFLFPDVHDENFEMFERGFAGVETISAILVANGTTSVAEACAELNISRTELGKILRYMRLILFAQCGKHIFRTSSGRLGHAPVPTSPGDCICFIPAGELLHVLSCGCTRFVAFASVEGFMGDDLLKIVPTDKSQWQEFHLV